MPQHTGLIFPGTPVPLPNKSQSEKALRFFFAVVGFFCISLIWNFYFQFGSAHAQAKARNNHLFTAMCLQNMATDRNDRKGQGQGCGRLSAANAAPAAVSPVYVRSWLALFEDEPMSGYFQRLPLAG